MKQETFCSRLFSTMCGKRAPAAGLKTPLTVLLKIPRTKRITMCARESEKQHKHGGENNHAALHKVADVSDDSFSIPVFVWTQAGKTCSSASVFTRKPGLISVFSPVTRPVPQKRMSMAEAQSILGRNRNAYPGIAVKRADAPDHIASDKNGPLLPEYPGRSTGMPRYRRRKCPRHCFSLAARYSFPVLLSL